MTAGDDADESADADVDENEAVPSGADDTSVTFDEYDPDPTAGGSDIGGRAGGDDDDSNGGGDRAGGGDTGTGQGPTNT
ncbi:MAG: hypothetical protein ABI186_02885 [Candidatus Elarobacter sp.]